MAQWSRYLYFSLIFLGAFVAFQPVSPRAYGASPVRRLTTSGDVMEFVWSPRGDALYVTRESKIVTLTRTRQQIIGDLYRVNVENGASELLAGRANTPRVSSGGDEIAFARLNDDRRAQAVVLDARTNQERAVGEISFGSPPQWNRTGDTVFFLYNGGMQRAKGTASSTLFRAKTFPDNARVSALADRVAYLDDEGLWVAQESARSQIARSENGAVVLPQFAWSNAGDKLAYTLTHDGFDPELWIADTTRSSQIEIAKGKGLEHLANLAWSPDDTRIIFTRTPTGSSAGNDSEIWRASTDGSETRALTQNNAEETLPQYAPDGRAIAFLRDGDVWLMELNADGIPQAQEINSPERAPNFETARALNAGRTPPLTIRVRHDAANACRSVPLGQIDTIDFEMYVKRVVPAEVFPSWDDDALKTQAVATRNYAWFWILQHILWDYDVTDTTEYQYMCDMRYASTDNATEATRGQYLDYQGYMVFAAYGAENGDPTMTNTFNNPYLIGVDDPVGFMKTRAGNGIGYSQWGAQRWATQYDWNYQQILLHYYSNVTLEAPMLNGMDSSAPIGAIVAPWNQWGIASNRVRLLVNASDDLSGVAAIDLNAQYVLNGARSEIIATLQNGEREFVWDVSALPNQTDIVVTPVLHDANGNSANGASVSFDLDRKNPQGTLSAPATTTEQTITLNLEASDSGGSQLAGMMFSNDWEWQGENQFFQDNSASVVADPDALNGSALRGAAGVNPPGAWYGPYTNVLPTNQPYRAYFRLKTDNVNTTAEIALLDVVVDGGTSTLGIKRVRGTDFKAANAYQEFYVDFYYTGFSSNPLEFRAAYRANASLWLDRILVVRYPVSYAPRASWKLTDGNGNKRVVAKFLDGAGNVSSDAISTIFFGKVPPPPRVWLPLLLQEK